MQPLVVTSPSGPSSSISVQVASTQPGLLAPGVFAVGGKQYVAALLPDGSYVLPPNSVPGVQSRRARPGEVITLFGIGFGSVTPTFSPGQIVTQSNTLTSPVQFAVGGVNASSSYSGLAPGLVGLYQFNVLIPSVPASDSVELTFSQGGVSGSQSLVISIGNLVSRTGDRGGLGVGVRRAKLLGIRRRVLVGLGDFEGGCEPAGGAGVLGGDRAQARGNPEARPAGKRLNKQDACFLILIQHGPIWTSGAF